MKEKSVRGKVGKKNDDYFLDSCHLRLLLFFFELTKVVQKRILNY